MTAPTTPPPDDPAALARELARKITDVSETTTFHYRNEFYSETFAILPPTLERLVRERDARKRRDSFDLQSINRVVADQTKQLQAQLTAAQTAEREARALLEDVVSTSDAHGGIMTSQCDRKEEEHCDCGTRLMARIRAHLARGAEGKHSQ